MLIAGPTALWRLRFTLPKILLLLLWAGFPLVGHAGSAQEWSKNSETGAETWATQSNGVFFSMTQILPDQARAFYINRGFSQEQIESYAISCVYMTVIRNDNAEGAIQFELDNWSIEYNDQSKPPVKVADWIERLEENGAGKSALIAFRWAQFPPAQEYEPGGDWNQGMLSTGTPAGSEFNIIARWSMGGEVFEGSLKNVRCAK